MFEGAEVFLESGGTSIDSDRGSDKVDNSYTCSQHPVPEDGASGLVMEVEEGRELNILYSDPVTIFQQGNADQKLDFNNCTKSAD